MALSKFCRVTPNRIRTLDLRQRVSGLTTAMLLGFQHSGVQCPRCSSHRLGYAFCPSCVANQPVIHVPWEWSLSCLTLHSPSEYPMARGAQAPFSLRALLQHAKMLALPAVSGGSAFRQTVRTC